MELGDVARDLPGLGMAPPRALETLGIRTVADLVHYMPRRHEDRRKFKPIATLLDGELAIVRGVLERIRPVRLRGRRSLVAGALADESGAIELRWWNQPWLMKTLQKGMELVVFGKVREGKITQPEFEIVRPEEQSLHVGRIVPVYPLTKGVTAPGLRRAVHAALEGVRGKAEDPLPETLLQRRELPELNQALQEVHFPDNRRTLARAKKRFKYDELFYFQLAVLLRRARARLLPGIMHRWNPKIDERIRARFPFPLTAAQDRAIREILQDLQAPEPMNRLLQGDVGSGKTAVALYGALVAIASRTQVAFLAPTEVLARQHHATVAEFLADSDVSIELLVGSTPAADRKRLLAGLASGEVNLIVGTHALLEPSVEFDRLGFVIVDEQHKFGVHQRAKLIRKGVRPDVLVMTATPIPRTLALTAFGDLDVSVLNELPPGRRPPHTRVLADGQRAYERVRSEAAAGRQSYVIFPLVEESEDIAAQAAEEGFDRLATGQLHGLRLGLITGRTAPGERQRFMGAFRAGMLDVLVGTTVLEVGVDVANATVMVVENAERFGLSTLHQLRGRIGRGTAESYCFLVAHKLTDEARQRLAVMEETNDGFRIADEDLRLRGPGEFFGTRQHGMPEFRVADLVKDYEIMRVAREDAYALLAADGRLERHSLLRAELLRRFAGRIDLYEVG